MTALDAILAAVMRRTLLVAVPIAVCWAAVWLLQPLRWEVDGLSMAPGLMPGDIVKTGPWPRVGRLWPLQRFDRWIVRVEDGFDTVKRLVGLPGERVEIAEGDLWIDGLRLLTPPALLAEMALAVPFATVATGAGSGRAGFETALLDDAPFATGERRLLLPARDVGLAAVVDVAATSAKDPWRISLSIDERAVRFTPTGSGRHALIAGRLDGRFVAAAWRIEGTEGVWRGAIPPVARQPGITWTIATDWPEAGEPQVDPPALAWRIEAATNVEGIQLERIVVWRDVVHRPAANGITSWRLSAGEVFCLGDFPSASRDCRIWGPIAATSLRFRVSGPESR